MTHHGKTKPEKNPGIQCLLGPAISMLNAVEREDGTPRFKYFMVKQGFML